MADTKFVQDFTEGSIPKKLLRFSVPFMLSNAMQVLYSLVDMLVVGRIIGSAGLSAVTIGSNIFNFMAMLALGFCNSGQILISQQIGSGRRDRIKYTVGTLFTIAISIGAVMTVIGLTLCRQLLNLMQTPAESYDMAVSYVLVCAGGVLFSYGYNMISAVLRGMGDSRHPFIFILTASVINIVLDILFVGTFKMGTAGAALATIIGQGAAFVCAVIFLYRRRESFGFDFALKSFIPDKEIFGVLVKLGIPLTLSSCAVNISMLFVTSLVNTAGVVASAAYGVGLKLDDIVNRVTFGIGMAVTSMIGQNFASRRFDRVKKTVYSSWAFTVIAYIIFTAVYLIFSREMFAVFTSDVDVIEMGPVFVSAIVWSFPANIIMRGTHGFIQGIGYARFALIIALLDGFVFRIGFSWLFGTVLGFGVWGYFFGFGMATYGTALPAMLYFFFGKWEKRAAVSTGGTMTAE